MKKIIASLILFSFIFSSPLLSQKCYNTGPEEKLSKISGSPSRTQFNINNISTWIYNNGDQDIQPTGHSGFIYPKGSGIGTVFESGLVWGGKIEGEIYVGGSTYWQGLLPGRVLSNGEREVGVDGDKVRIFRVRPDYANGDLSTEITDGEGTTEEIQAQYQLDWNEWPADWGAPFEDKDGNSIYDPSIDIPGVPGADQTIWYVANDLDTSTCKSNYGSDPMGVELQVTMWGNNVPGHLGNVMFKKYKLFNKSDKDFTDMYVTQWHDMDIGYAGDDLQGIDTLLSMIFGYNGEVFDDNYKLNSPAIGFQLLQGPIVNSEHLKFTSNYFYLCGGPLPWIDPNGGEYVTGSLRMYSQMQGIHMDGTQIYIPEQFGKGTTTFPISGNPITGEGWLDGYIRPACDIRGIASSGPFTIESGEFQEIVIAQLAAQGTDRLNSVALLKYYASILQKDYPNVVKDNSQNTLHKIVPAITINEFSEYDVIELNIDQGNSLEDLSESGYTFQGYKIYQSLYETEFVSSAHNIFTYDINDDVTKIYGETYDPNTGYLTNDLLINGNNSGIPRIAKIEKDFINDSPLIKGKDYFFGITAYFYNQGENKVIESEPNFIKINFQKDLPGASFMDRIENFEVNGNSDILFDIEIIDPSKLTGDTYEVSFGEQHYYLDNNGDWTKTNYPDSIGKKLAKPIDLSNSKLTPLPSLYSPQNTIDIMLEIDIQSTDNSYADSIKVIFPQGIKINSTKMTTRYGYEITYFDKRIDNQVITWDASGNSIKGGEILTINIDFVEPTFSIDFTFYDDSWGEIQTNANGTIKLTGEIGYQFKKEIYWDLFNKTQNKYSLENQLIFGGRNISDRYGEQPEYGYEPIVDGYRIKLDGSFEVPINFSKLELNEESKSTLTTSTWSSEESISITNYTVFGGTISSWANDNYGIGTTNIEILEQDYELRFTGVYDKGTLVGGKRVYKVIEGGSYATCFRMVSENGLAQHPLNPNPGSTEPFLVRIPFEVWNVEDPENQFQVNLAFRDRDRDGSEDPFWAWNPNDRMYAVIVNSPYNPNQVIQVEDGTDEFNALATWVLVFWQTQYSIDDIVKITYANPIEFTDKYTFTTPEAPTDKIFPDKYEIFQNYPNPFNPNTKIRYYIPEEGNVTITIYNVLGQKVTEVINKTLKAGKYETEFNGSNFASGVYIYRIEVDSPTKANIYSETKKMLLLK